MRVGKGQLAQQKSIDDCKDGDIRADGERKSEHSRDRKTRRPAQLAKRVPNILKQCVHPRVSSVSYSVLSACMGSIEAARRAGINPARAAHTTSMTGAPASASGS